jgi:hypothetical protein
MTNCYLYYTTRIHMEGSLSSFICRFQQACRQLATVYRNAIFRMRGLIIRNYTPCWLSITQQHLTAHGLCSPRVRTWKVSQFTFTIINFRKKLCWFVRSLSRCVCVCVCVCICLSPRLWTHLSTDLDETWHKAR